MTATEYEEAKAAFAAEQAKQAKEAATAAAAAAAVAKPKGIAKGFLTAGTPAKATNGTSGAKPKKKSSAVEDVSDEDSDECPLPGGSTPRHNGAPATAAAGGGGGGGKQPNGNGVVDVDDDNDDGPPGLTDTEEEVPRMRYSHPETFAAPAANPPPPTTTAPPPPKPAAKPPAKKNADAPKAKDKDKEKAQAAEVPKAEAPTAPDPAKPAQKPKAAKAAAAPAGAPPPPKQATAKAAPKDDDEGMPDLIDEGLDVLETADMPGLARASSGESGEDSDEQDAPGGPYVPKWGGAPPSYTEHTGRTAQKDDMRKRMEEKLRKKGEGPKAKEPTETLQQEKDRLLAEASERAAKELLEEEEKQNAKKKKAAAKKKEKKAKKKKVADPFVPQYMDEAEEAAQAAEAKLAAEAEERAKAEKASTSAPRVEQEESNMDDLMALANLKLGGAREAAAAEQLPKGKGRGRGKKDPSPAAPQAADKGKAPVVGVQEALAFGGVRTTQPQPPKEAAPPKPTGPTQKEVLASLEAAMTANNEGDLGSAIVRASGWLNSQPKNNNKQLIKVQKTLDRAREKQGQMLAPPVPAPTAANTAAPMRQGPPPVTPQRPAYNPLARPKAAQMPQPSVSAFPSNVQALFGAPRPAVPGPGPPSPSGGFNPQPLRQPAAPPQQPYRPPPPPGVPAPPLAGVPPVAAGQQFAAQPPLPPPMKPPTAPAPQAAGVHASLGEVYEDLAHENECCVCLENERTMVFSPCGHLVTCKGCSDLFWNGSRQCPYCRKTILDIFAVRF
ncbi:hypothetical protein WJX75_006020 [Coccomyxa subellipsoidea]|uniref:RING-type domain-containing protein n=1 Tax=Coccomyxa subellipsoidea TaxID=248742 RepID=A0ABR2YL22_9CHLO